MDSEGLPLMGAAVLSLLPYFRLIQTETNLTPEELEKLLTTRGSLDLAFDGTADISLADHKLFLPLVPVECISENR